MAHTGFSLSNTGVPVIGDGGEEDLSPKFRVASERFSTVGLAEPERVELWEDHNARALVGLGARTINDSVLDATEVNLHLEKLNFAHVTANAHVVERNACHIRSKPTDSVVLYFALYGEAFFYQDDGVKSLTPGTVVVCDTDKPFVRGFAKGLKELVLMVPRSTFMDVADGVMPKSDNLPVLNFGRSTKANDHATTIAELMTRSLMNPELEAVQKVEDEVVDLLRGIFGSTSSTGLSSQLRIAMSYIDRHLRNPELAAPQIASAIGISERQLSRVFSDHGKSVSRVILERRLELANRILRSARSDQMSVTEVAHYVGFASLPHFSRTFKSQFNMTPKEVRMDISA